MNSEPIRFLIVRAQEEDAAALLDFFKINGEPIGFDLMNLELGTR